MGMAWLQGVREKPWGGGAQIVPRADPKSRPAPCQSPSYAASPTVTSSLASLLTPHRQQNPKHPKTPTAKPQTSPKIPKHLLRRCPKPTLPLPHSTHQEEEAPSPHPGLDLLSHITAQLQLVPISTGAPQLLVKPLAQQRGCGDRSHKKTNNGVWAARVIIWVPPSRPLSRDVSVVLENEPSPLMR